ncbi:MAG: nickel pincer cofactor biosynthesis protein LarB [Nitrospinae bacterium]|nr:nickel pincer cofactor biosynthesis protein LarB [Nitrospinota bacterium]MBI3814863.1 nickel pincer cofactor biosynthesis protein LarB [Nitrospinota bacterium]
MNRSDLKKIVTDIYNRKVTTEKAIEMLRHLPYEDLGFASVDHHRGIRQGFPEVIYCEGKTIQQIKTIIERMLKKGSDILATRAAPEIFKKVRKIDKRAEYNKDARTIVIKNKTKKLKGMVLVATAGTSDIPVGEEAAVTAETMGSKVERVYDVGVAGIHRLLDKRERFMAARVIVVVAGMDGALASVVGGLVDKPVIAVPTSIGYGASFGGISALLSMLNSCAAGVAVVNIDNGFGAGCLAHRINMLGD